MKYGYIENGKLVYIGRDDNGVWKGHIYYNDKGEKLFPTEVLSMFGNAGTPLKEIVVPPNFDGNYANYNFVEQNGKIVLAGLKAAAVAEQQRQANMRRISELKKLLAETDYKVIKCAEAQILGLEMPYDVQEITAQRQECREEINELEAKYAD
jgi:hypothetical protein